MPAPDDPIDLQRLERAVARLPRMTRDIFLAKRIDGFSYEEIAGRTGLTVRQVERHMAKAIYRISKAVDERREPSWWRRLLDL